MTTHTTPDTAPDTTSAACSFCPQPAARDLHFTDDDGRRVTLPACYDCAADEIVRNPSAWSSPRVTFASDAEALDFICAWDRHMTGRP